MEDQKQRLMGYYNINEVWTPISNIMEMFMGDPMARKNRANEVVGNSKETAEVEK